MPHSAHANTPNPAISPFCSVDDALADLRAGRMIVLTDDEDRENEGDLVMAAQFVSPEAISFMLRQGAGYLFVSLTESDCDRLDLHPQTPVNTSVRGTPLTVSIDGHPKHGFTTGVSAHERARTIRLAIDPASSPADFVRPGHINPLRARDGGVLVRIGQTEGSVDLCRLAGLHPSAVGIEIMREDGQMARVPDLVKFCATHGLKMCSVAQIIEHRLRRDPVIRRIEPAHGTPLRTPLGDFTLLAFESVFDPLPHLALTLGGVGDLDPLTGGVRQTTRPTLVRMHRRHLLGDVFGDLDSTRANTPGGSASVLHAAMAAIQREGAGALVYLRPQSPPDSPADTWGITGALEQRLQTPRAGAVGWWAHAEPELPATQHAPGSNSTPTPRANPRDTDPHDRPKLQHLPPVMRDYGVGCQILRALGLSQLRLLTNSAAELPGLDAFGLSIAERIPISLDPLAYRNR
ncbi:MAG: 3,4-dihydroxy-2-butanone-4-phosphate synthase [Phycisphaeraceae bacterium]|nr:3,4-dihydroxy-2-butanone-4-phosphate synthase [Phycisphaeraceae bacterium]